MRGCRQVACADATWLISAGEGFSLAADTPHSCRCEEKHSYRVLSVDPQLWQKLDDNRKPPTQSLAADSPALVAIRRLIALARQTADPLALDVALQAVAAALTPPPTELQRPPPAVLARLREWLDSHCTEIVRLHTLAAMAGCSPSLVNRAFREHFGLPPYEYLLQRRLRLAAQRLREDEMSLAETALASGFADQSHFQRMFRRAYGATPAAYRAASRTLRQQGAD